jgi:hypothetical protein
LVHGGSVGHRAVVGYAGREMALIKAEDIQRMLAELMALEKEVPP